jgi:hypothetical protein
MRLTRALRGARREFGVVGFLPANATGVETPSPGLAEERGLPWVHVPPPPNRIAVVATTESHRAPTNTKPTHDPGLLRGFAYLFRPRTGTEGNSRQASKPQRRERIRTNRNVPKEAKPQSRTGSAARRHKRTLFPSDEATLLEPSPVRQPPSRLPWHARATPSQTCRHNAGQRCDSPAHAGVQGGSLASSGSCPANANGVETRKPRVGRGTRPTLGPRPTAAPNRIAVVATTECNTKRSAP